MTRIDSSPSASAPIRATTGALITALCAWGPSLVLMALIFFASAQSKTPPPPGTTSTYFSGPVPIFPGGWDALVKKSAHVAMYGLLSALYMRALMRHGIPAREAAYTAILLAVGYALTDELHQSFVTGRHSSVLDIGLDYVGAALAGLTIRRIIKRRSVAPDTKTLPARKES